jgi:ferredoxin
MPQLSLDPDRCQGHAMCYLLAPNLFEIDDDGRGTVIDPALDESRKAEALIAVARCPEGAITVGDA